MNRPNRRGAWLSPAEIDWYQAENAYLRNRNELLTSVIAHLVADEAVGVILDVPTRFAKELKAGLQSNVSLGRATS